MSYTHLARLTMTQNAQIDIRARNEFLESGHVNSTLLIQVRRLFQLSRSSRSFHKRPDRDRNPIAPVVNQLATSSLIRERLMRDSIKFNDSRLGRGTVGVTPFRFFGRQRIRHFLQKVLNWYPSGPLHLPNDHKSRDGSGACDA